MTYSNTRKKKLQRRKYKGGGNKLVKYDPNVFYSSTDLDLSYKHTWTLHHYQIDLNLIASMNLDEQERSIYDEAKFTEIVGKYSIQATEFRERNILLWVREIMYMGEIVKKDAKTGQESREPVCIKADGQFYDRTNTVVYPTYDREQSPILGKTVYMFASTYKEAKPNQTANANPFIYAFKNVIQQKAESIRPDDVMSAVGIYDNQTTSIYAFNRIRITADQTDSLHTYLMNYNLLAILNTDRSTDAAGKFRYRTHQQFGFFDYGSIQHSYKTWAKQDLNSDQYKRALFVGFYKYSDDLYRPVYLKPNGWFSDGYYDYSPTFATVTITEKMLRDNGLLWDEEDRRYLVGKVAYLFDWGPKTVGAIAYNRYFRMEIIVKRLTWTLAFSAIGVFISLLYGTALMAAIVTCITWKIVFGTGIGAVTYVANNSGGKKRRKNKWKSFKQKMNNTRRRGRASNAV